MPKNWTLLLLSLLLLPVSSHAQAQETPTVYAVIFYSPSCPHCHDLLDDTWPPVQDEFGEQLVTLYVNVAEQGGSYLASQAYDQHNIPQNQRGVPMMVVGDALLIGGYDIPTQAPGIIRDGLASGGLPVPNVPALREAFDASQATQADSAANNDASDQDAAPENTGAVDTDDVTPNLLDTLLADPIANGAALLVLFGSLASVLAVLAIGIQRRKRLPTAAIGDIALFGAALAVFSLLLQAQSDVVALVSALTAGFAIVMAALLRFQRQDRSQIYLALLALAGLVVAAYLAYVELMHTPAACGLVGDCNAVQQSQYAYLFGVLPIGVLGVAGYIAMLLTLLWRARMPQSPTANVALFGMALFGVAFSVYLTYLEVFVIGATCMWCLLSALLMLALLWLSADRGLRSLWGHAAPMTSR